MLDKELISRNFSQSAGNYEAHALLQKEMADELFARVMTLKPKNILDIGCGTGYLANRLAEKMPTATVKGLDIASGMIGVANNNYRSPNLSFLVGDGEELGANRQLFDLIVSNASLQWMDMARTLAGAAAVLRAGGHFLFNTFGPGTLYELKASGFHVNEFLSVNRLLELADRRYKIVEIRSRTVQQRFHSAKELIRHLKEVGAHNPRSGPRANILGSLKKYKEKYAAGTGVVASYEIIFGHLLKA